MQHDGLKIRLAFDPEALAGWTDHPEEDKAILAKLLKRDGLPLRVWVIVKMRYMTNQHFLPSLLKLQQHCDDAQGFGWPAWDGLPHFLAVLDETGVTGALFGNWAMAQASWPKLWLDHWDYMNPNIRRAMWCEYTSNQGVHTLRQIGQSCEAAPHWEVHAA